ncbi:5-(carboxyamino)imidazole ribonucleotide synthase [Phragmitibacter flavus]|uniref:N5-carboxyaminoimidazole ribonucleotide synthase n=1 Tax=Phragmitibacter flavus TaxID=2576071 RepID=A0A5R8KB29_9BACT|nr:5-(carboxyamino)imidazole ribonucleotide synthase [Phragmitibacter flavus]TLD69510.1 5-(carboxyamino)imidazole ribonucleotide synthase [Phragmitibacter flavus]
MPHDSPNANTNWPLVIGILGGGQLALMLARSASQLGMRVHVLDPSPTCPAKGAAAEHTLGSWSDPEALLAFAQKVDVITVENEFVEADKLAALERQGHTVLPSSETMRLVQDKLVQKQMLGRFGIPVVDFMPVADEDELQTAVSTFGFPFVLKKRTLGYDGTGNFTVSEPADLQAGVNKLGGFAAGLYAEKWCPFTMELAVIVTRNTTGTTAIYPVVESRQHNHVCSSVLVPAAITPEQANAAYKMAVGAVEAVNGVGSFGIELFMLEDGTLRLNEMAPRVHNSGHYTLEACDCSQFENHLRAVCGLPLGSVALRSGAAMVNILAEKSGKGSPVGLADAMAVPGACLHFYGKLRAEPRRKMGHVTALGETPLAALATAELAAGHIRFED